MQAQLRWVSTMDGMPAGAVFERDEVERAVDGLSVSSSVFRFGEDIVVMLD